MKQIFSSDFQVERELARAALELYGLGGARLALLARRGTTLWRVDSAEDQRFVLRVYGREAPPPAEVESEAIWLRALNRDTRLVVPRPVGTAGGDLVGAVDGRMVALFGWVAGRFFKPATLRRAHLREVGRLMGALHDYADNFVPPNGFTRPRWRWSGRLFTPGAAIYREVGRAFLSDGDLALIEAVSDKTDAEMGRIAARPQLFGLIHGDLQHTNYLFAGGKARAIDFGDCGWSYYPFDMAVTLADVMGRDDEAELREAFFDGYEEYHALPPDYEALMGPFTAIRLARRINYLLGGHDPKQTGLAAAWIDRSLRWMRGYVAG